MTGSRPINLEREWDDVEAFVNDLKSALNEEAKTIRETELDKVVGEYHSISVQTLSDDVDWKAETLDAFVDRLGRVFLPPKPKFETAVSITFLDDGNGSKPEMRKVGSVECRFRGEEVMAYVVYLEEEPS